MENECTARPRCFISRVAMELTKLESKPPERSTPIGASDMRRLWTDLTKASCRWRRSRASMQLRKSVHFGWNPSFFSIIFFSKCVSHSVVSDEALFWGPVMAWWEDAHFVLAAAVLDALHFVARFDQFRRKARFLLPEHVASIFVDAVVHLLYSERVSCSQKLAIMDQCEGENSIQHIAHHAWFHLLEQEDDDLRVTGGTHVNAMKLILPQLSMVVDFAVVNDLKLFFLFCFSKIMRLLR